VIYPRLVYFQGRYRQRLIKSARPLAADRSPFGIRKTGMEKAQYWADRRRRQTHKAPPLAPSVHRALRAQGGRCPACGRDLLFTDRTPNTPDQWEDWYRDFHSEIRHQEVTTRDANGRAGGHYRLMHADCLHGRRHGQ